MQSKLWLSLAGLVLGIGVAGYPRASQAFFEGGIQSCADFCAYTYAACVFERGLKAGCGREQRACLRVCNALAGG